MAFIFVGSILIFFSNIKIMNQANYYTLDLQVFLFCLYCSHWKNFNSSWQRRRRLCMASGEVKEAETDGGKARMSAGSVGGDGTEMDGRGTVREQVTGREVHHLLGETDTELGGGRRGESTTAEGRTDLRTQLGSKGGIGSETGTRSERWTGTERGTDLRTRWGSEGGIESEKGTRRERWTGNERGTR